LIPGAGNRNSRGKGKGDKSRACQGCAIGIGRIRCALGIAERIEEDTVTKIIAGVMIAAGLLPLGGRVEATTPAYSLFNIGGDTFEALQTGFASALPIPATTLLFGSGLAGLLLTLRAARRDRAGPRTAKPGRGGCRQAFAN
jgi:hypothetical protein